MYFAGINFEACKKAVNFIPNLNDTKGIFNIEHCSFALKSLNCWIFHFWILTCSVTGKNATIFAAVNVSF